MAPPAKPRPKLTVPTDVLSNTPPPPSADLDVTAVAEWLGGLLDAARDRGDTPVARLVAGVMDDLRGAKG